MQNKKELIMINTKRFNNSIIFYILTTLILFACNPTLTLPSEITKQNINTNTPSARYTKVCKTKAELVKELTIAITPTTPSPNLNYIDTSQITDMSGLFRDKRGFNGNISSWNVSNVKTMENMFAFASAFNGNISSWNVSNVKTMEGMFYYASAFNQDLLNWNVSKVTNMRLMFSGASAFNGNISSWNVANVTAMDGMFASATVFNGNISGWRPTALTDMRNMFQYASAFDKNIESWNLASNVNKTGAFTSSGLEIDSKLKLPTWAQHIVTYHANKPDDVPSGVSVTNLPDPATVNVDSGGTATAPKLKPKLQDYKFLGWFVGTTTGDAIALDSNVFDFENTAIKENKYLYAKWTRKEITITFYGNKPDTAPTDASITGLTADPTIVTVNSGETTTALKPPPELTGYTLDGWFIGTTSGGTLALQDTAFDFTTTTIRGENINLYAKWSQDFVVTFDTQGGSPIDPQRLTGTLKRATRPNVDPTREDYTFDNWYTMATGGDVYDFSATTPITASITIYARWIQSTYTITFNQNYGDTPATSTVTTNQEGKVSPPDLSTQRPGYFVIGWFKTNDGIDKIDDFTTEVFSGEITLYAKWGFRPSTKDELIAEINRAITPTTPSPNLNYIDTSLIKDMSELFKDKRGFNGNISSWNVSLVEDMSYMFGSATAFNGNISSWNVSKVTNMEWMFNAASAFNQNISSWNVSKVTKMSLMFFGATTFNQNISGWNVSKVTTMQGIFAQAVSFNQNISSWNVAKVTDMRFMFSGARVFNGNISGWRPTALTKMAYMFQNAEAFNKNIDSWNIASSVDKTDAFKGSGLASNLPTWAQKTKPTVTVTYDVNKPSSATADVTGVPNSAMIIQDKMATAPPSPTLDGYTFDGWYSDQATTTVFEFSTAITENITLYAKWTAKQTFTVSYNANKPTGAIDNVMGVPTDVNVIINLATTEPSTEPTLVGYTFEGWYTEQTTTTAFVFTRTITVNIDLYAKWTIQEFTVTYDVNKPSSATADVAGPPTPVMINYNLRTSAPNPEPTLVGYTFEGWYYEQATTTAFEFTRTAITENITLYAKWTAKPIFTVSYNVNKPTGAVDNVMGVPTDVKVIINLATTEPSPEPTLVGYTFEGWYYEQATTTAFEFTRTAITENITLYAKWTAKPIFTVTYNANKPTSATDNVMGMPTDVKVIINLVTTEPSPEPTLVGYTFEGWYYEQATTTAFEFTRTAITENITLYAKWVFRVFRPFTKDELKAEINRAITPTTPSPNLNYIDTSLIEDMSYLFLNKSDFNGDISSWNVSKVTNMSYMFGSATAFNGNISSWNVSKVTTMQGMFLVASAFNQNISSWNVAKVTDMSWMFQYARAFNKNIDSWNIASSVDKTDAFIGSGLASNLPTWAQKTKPTFTVTYNVNKPTTATADVTVVPYSAMIIQDQMATAPPSPALEGYTFDGWYYEQATTTAFEFTRTAITENITLYAKWTAKPTVTVTYNVNKPTSATDNVMGMPTDVKVIINLVTTEPSPEPTLVGYTFEGWYVEKATINQFNFSQYITANITLYAKWTAKPTFTVSYNVNKPTAATADVTVVPYSAMIIQDQMATAPPSPALEGYTFDGWYYEQATTTAFEFTRTAITENITLYAKWTAKPTFTVSYNVNKPTAATADVTVVPNSAMIIQNQMATEPPSPALDGYTFDGWYYEQATTTAFEFTRTAITENITLYAKWVFRVFRPSTKAELVAEIDTAIKEKGNEVDLNYIDTSLIEDMSYLFLNKSDFNGDISSWNVSLVEDMSYMFGSATAFNGNISSWNVSKVTTMQGMFLVASAFNQNISSWNVSLVEDMSFMFNNASAFTQNINSWNIASSVVKTDAFIGSGLASNLPTWAQKTKPTFTVSYNVNKPTAATADVTVVPNSAMIIQDQMAIEPPSPVLDGYTFDGWYYEQATTTAFEFTRTAITENITLYAKWTAKPTFTVSYNVNKPTAATADVTGVPNSAMIIQDQMATAPPSPALDGYTFDGWYSDQATTTVFEFSTAITENITLYAKWTAKPTFTVSYNVNKPTAATADVTVVPNSAMIIQNQMATAPPSPALDGYTFAGWYYEQATTTAFEFTRTAITENITLYAKWTAKPTFTVSYNVNKPTAATADVTVVPNSAMIIQDKMATAPPSPVLDGYTFDGWYYEQATTTAFEFTRTAITENITLYAKWTAKPTFTVSYNVNKPTAATAEVTVVPNSAMIIQDKMATAPPSPALDGYTFDGWYYDQATTAVFEFTRTAITENITLYAKWVFRVFRPSTKAELLAEINRAIAEKGNEVDLNYIDTSLIKDMSELFKDKRGFNGNISSWNVSLVKNMSNMFRFATTFNGNISSWNVSQVENMSGMFYYASAFNGNISSWNVSNVTNMSYMFYYANKFNGNISNWNVSIVTNMESMFNGARVFNQNISSWNVVKVTQYDHFKSNSMLTDDNAPKFIFRPSTKAELLAEINRAIADKGNEVDLNYIDTTLIDDMSELFKDKYRFNGDISEWNVSKVTNMEGMFYSALYFNQNISSWNVSKVTNMSRMFDSASDFNGNISGWNVSKVTNMEGMFSWASAFNQDLNNWNVSLVEDMSYMFAGATAFNGNISSWDVSKVTKMEGMFWGASTFNQNISSWNVAKVTKYASFWFNSMLTVAHTPKFRLKTKSALVAEINRAIKEKGNEVDLNYIDTSLINDMSSLFGGKSTFNGNISSWNVSKVTNMQSMFSGARAFNQNISSWNVSKVNNMNSMFNFATVFNGDISSWNVSLVEDMGRMFDNAIVFNGDISNWNVSLVKNMSKIFNKAEAFNGNISSWNVAKVTDMSNMFSGAKVFNQDLSSWNVSNVEDMESMFSGATDFNGDISGWNVAKVTYMRFLFAGASAFNQNISSWNVSLVKNMNNMFYSARVFNQNISSWNVAKVTGYTNFRKGSRLSDAHTPKFRLKTKAELVAEINRAIKENGNEVDLNYIDTSLIKDMSGLFGGKSSFNGNISSWNVSKVTNMSWMFQLARVFNGNISSWNVSNVKDMQGMFGSATAFNGNISSWNVARVTNMSNMFYSARVFNQNISSWNVSLVENMSGMFEEARFFNQNISSWNVSKVANMSNMFYSARVFNQNISSWNVAKVTDMSLMFNQAVSFNQNLSSWNVSLVEDMSSMFFGATVFNGNISSWNVSKVEDMRFMFYRASAFNQNISSWNVSKVTNMQGMFRFATAFNQNISNWSVSLVENMEYMFNGATDFNGDIRGWNVAKVTYMRFLFAGASAFNQNISSWNVSLVEDMSLMFGGATAFNQNLSSWNVSLVEDMSSMFFGATVFNGNISSWNVSQVENMNSMFRGASAFNQNISSWNVARVTNMTSMFYRATAFNQNISSWNVSLVENMSSMFWGAIAFNQNISSWNVSKVTNMSYMFQYASRFNGNISSWNVAKVTEYTYFKSSPLTDENTPPKFLR